MCSRHTFSRGSKILQARGLKQINKDDILAKVEPEILQDFQTTILSNAQLKNIIEGGISCTKIGSKRTK